MTLSNTAWVPQQPWKGGLVNRGLPVPDGVEWRVGVRFNSNGCVAPLLQDTCNPTDKTPTRIGAENEFLPVEIIQPVECATIGNVDLARLASERLETTTEWALGQELAYDAAGLGNPKLTDATPTAYACAKAALAALIGQASQIGFGAYLTVHLTPAAAVLLATEMVEVDWLTYIVSPGYGEQPQIWVTGPTFVGVDKHVDLSGVQRVENTKQEIAERLAIAFFDPCILLSATFANDCSS